jgi:hypothetical protein
MIERKNRRMRQLLQSQRHQLILTILLPLTLNQVAQAQPVSVASAGDFVIGDGINQILDPPEVLPKDHLLRSHDDWTTVILGQTPGQFDGTLFQWDTTCPVSSGPDLNAPLVTDRPDFTEASSTVGRGVAQLEFGYTFTRDDTATTQMESHSFAEPLLRYGIIAEWLELRIAANYATEKTNGVKLNGTEDLYLGFKIGLTPQDGLLPEMALIPQMTAPTGASVFTADDVLPGANWIYGWELSDCLSTAGSTQVNRAIDDVTGSNYAEWAQSWTFAYTITEQIGAYTEWYAFFPETTAVAEHYLNGGFTVLLNDDIQWDIRVGRGLSGAADDYFIGTGLSVRFK